MPNPPALVVLSRYQAAPMLDARAAGRTSAMASLDLNLSSCEMALDERGVALPDGQVVGWETIRLIAGSENGCFRIGQGMVTKVQAFSDLTQRTYSLYPTALAPTMLVAGLPMHRIKDTDPYHDTLAKIKAVAVTRGRVLDTCTGLGYTAIEAASVADEVITIELDPAAQEIARQNPWSQALFNTPRIRQVIGDSVDEVRRFDDGTFSRILHDPPTFALGGDLYSAGFYAELYRVLKPGGRLFHYIGDLGSASGNRVARGVAERLRRAGFNRITPQPQAFGLVAAK
jgi:predicted methyltransferase